MLNIRTKSYIEKRSTAKTNNNKTTTANSIFLIPNNKEPLNQRDLANTAREETSKQAVFFLLLLLHRKAEQAMNISVFK